MEREYGLRVERTRSVASSSISKHAQTLCIDVSYSTYSHRDRYSILEKERKISKIICAYILTNILND